MQEQERKGRIGIRAVGAASILALMSLTQLAAAEEKSSIPAISATSQSRATTPVAYFTENQAVEGSARYSSRWLGANWYFASAENRDLFKAGSGQIRAAIRRPLRGRGLARNDHHEHRSKGLADHRGQALPELRSRCGRRLRKETFQSGRLEEVLAGGRAKPGSGKAAEKLAISGRPITLFRIGTGSHLPGSYRPSSEKNLMACGLTWM